MAYDTQKSKKQKSYRFGIWAEWLAAALLVAEGYRILKLRYKNPKGEIDILARKWKTLAIVEVKARKNFAACEASISHSKQRKILQASEWLLAGRENKIAGLKDIERLNIRFDAIWVVPYKLPRHIKDAWRI